MEQIIKTRLPETITEAFVQKFEMTTGTSHSDVRLMLLRMQDHLDETKDISEEDRREIQRFLTENLKKPKLVKKSGSSTTAQGGGERKRDISTITLLAQVQALQARTYSNYWQTMWKQGSETMKMSLQFAPTIAKATLGAYQEQSKATKADAGKELQSAWIAGISCGALVGLGAYGAWNTAASKNADLAVSKETAGKTLEEATDKVNDINEDIAKLNAEKAEKLAAGEETTEIDEKLAAADKRLKAAEADQELAKSHEELWNARKEEEALDSKGLPKEAKAAEKAKIEAQIKAKEKEYADRYDQIKKDRGEMPSVLSNTRRSITSTMKKIGLSLSEGCHHAMQSLNMVQMPMTVANASSATQFDSEKSVHQALEGQCHALKSLGENFKANFDQNYQRSEDIRGMVQQFFDGTVIQTYKSAIETFAQTLISMSRA